MPLRKGDEIDNIDPNCNGGQTSISSPNGGKGTGKIFGPEGGLGSNGSKNTPHDAANMVFTLGRSGDGGDGGEFGASAGGNGGGGATNCYYTRNPNGQNTGPGAGDGTSGTDPSQNGGSNANGGNGGQGGRAGGSIWIRAQEIICVPNTHHFISKGLAGSNGQTATGQGGDGGSGGKGADGYCSSSGSHNIICPAGGNGLSGIGGNGADGGGGGDAGTHGTIWVGYSPNSTGSQIGADNFLLVNGAKGLGGSGGPGGIDGQQHQAQHLDTDPCECGGDYGTQTFDKVLDCMCEENFTRLANYQPDGLTQDGYPKWSLSGANPENRPCYYDTDANQLICYLETTYSGAGSPTRIERRTTTCGEFACNWTDGWFEDLHENSPTSTVTDHKVNFTNTGTYFFKSRILNGLGPICQPTCDVENEKIGKSFSNPKNGKKGADGEEFPEGPGHVYQYPSSSPSPTQIELPEQVFAIFPTLAENQLTMELEEAPEVPYQATLFNALGQPVQTWTLNEQTVSIDLSAIQSGSYIFVIEVNNQSYQQQLQIVK